jgi:hypothetical protein
MRRRIRRASIVLLSGALAISIGAAIIWLPDGAPLLTQRATRVATLPWPANFAQYEWVSDHGFVMLNSYLSHPPLTQVDTRTGAKVVLEGLVRRCGKKAVFPNFAVSPDGTRALWGGMDSKQGGVTSASLDGSSITRSGPIGGNFWLADSRPIWMRDGKRWAQLVVDERSLYAVVESLDQPGAKRTIPIGEPKGITRTANRVRTRLVGCTQTGRVVATLVGYDQSPSPQRKIDVIDFSVDGGPARVHEYTVTLPQSANAPDENYNSLSRYEEVQLSPRGDRLAWMVRVREDEQSLRQWLAQWLPSLRKAPRKLAELWTSKLDGSDMKIVGYLEMARYANHDPHTLRWLPNGRSMSFIYEGALWTVPAK